jgi:hypothetical protein
MTWRRFTFIVLVITGLLAMPAVAAARPLAVARPPLPQPMPQILRAACPGLEDEVAGCFIGAGEADVYGTAYPAGAVFTSGDQFETAHELGHAFDATMMDDGERNRFATLVGRLDEYWSSTYTDEQGRLIQSGDSLAEAFADAYANCRLGHVVASGHAWEAGYDYYPTARQHRMICKMISRAGGATATQVPPLEGHSPADPGRRLGRSRS